MRRNGKRRAVSTCISLGSWLVRSGVSGDTWGDRRGYGGSLGAGKAKADELEVMKLPMQMEG